MDRTLIIIGASVRAAAQSALRAGFQPWLADKFADRDLFNCGSVQQIEPYPSALHDIFREAPNSPWMYTGALENYPDLIQQLAFERKLWGNSVEVLRNVRDPLKTAQVFREAGFSVPEIQTVLTKDRSISWLQKSLRSAGGGGVTVVNDHLAVDQHGDQLTDHYFQQQIFGQPISAAYVAGATDVKLLGITTQLIGDDGSDQWWNTNEWTGAKGFWYAGSIGPITKPPSLLQQITNLGAHVAEAFDLVGIFGIDAILSNDILWPLEVNPRYTASVEIIERAFGFHAIELHAQACEDKLNAEGRKKTRIQGKANELYDTPLITITAKAVLYATDDLSVPPEFADWAMNFNQNSVWPEIADIPNPNSKIPRGAPICTVFVQTASENAAIDRLLLAAKNIIGQLNLLRELTTN